MSSSCDISDNILVWNTLNKLSLPILKFDNFNTHWINDINIHSTYSRLVITCSSSSLCRIIVFNNEEEKINEFNNNNKSKDKNIDINYNYIDYLEFDESVYKSEWSINNQWTFGAISYNGTFHINKIPDDLKFKIIIE